MKKIWMGAAGLIAAIVIAGAVKEYIWHAFEQPQVVGNVIQSREGDMEALSKEWFEKYTEKLEDWRVPYGYQIRGAKITGTQLLTDLEQPYVQLDYVIYPASDNAEIVRNLELIGTGYSYIYQGQMVLRWEEKAENEWVLAEKLSPVQYQLRTPEMQKEIKEPQTKHYKLEQDKTMTYYVADETLYVTYDSGNTYLEVPDGYEKVCKDSNGRYDELLAGGSYIVTPAFTAFVAYGEGTTLLYSTDEGRTWQESLIYKGGFRANTFLSKTENQCYVTVAVDRSLGSDYYATFYSADLQEWSQMTLPDMFWSNLGCAYWTAGGKGYYAKGESLYLTEDGGGTFVPLSFPEAQETVAALGYNPFDAVEQIYEADGLTYMIVGQGDDGDYAKDGKLVKGLYQSQDGVNFTFVSEVDNTPEEAG